MIHRYDVRLLHDWSTWLVDEKTGTLVVFGSHDTWSHTWGHAGRRDGLGRRDFRFELLSYGSGYIAQKLSSGVARELDSEATAQRFREKILRMRLEREIEADIAREWLDLIECDDQWFGRLLDEQYGTFEDLAVLRAVGQQHLDVLMVEHWPRVRAQMQARVMGERSLAWFRRLNA